MEKLQLTELEPAPEFLANPNNQAKCGVYIWGFCFPESGGDGIFKPYYVGRHETDIVARVRGHLHAIEKGTAKIFPQDVLQCEENFRNLASGLAVYDHAFQRKKHSLKSFPKTKLPNNEWKALEPHVATYLKHFHITYISLNHIADMAKRKSDVHQLERYVQVKLGNRVISRLGDRCGEEFSASILIETNKGTEHLVALFCP
jgi:hypothetical protein